MTRLLIFASVVLLLAVLTMGVYLHILRQNEQARALAAADMRPISAPVAGPFSEDTLCIAVDDQLTFRVQKANIGLPRDPAQRGREILHTLIGEYVKRPTSHELPADADVKGVFLVDGNTAVIDTNSSFADGHRSGIFIETLTIVSLVKTLRANLPEISRVKILVDGKERETLAGHADLQCFYDVVTVEQLLERLK